MPRMISTWMSSLALFVATIGVTSAQDASVWTEARSLSETIDIGLHDRCAVTDSLADQAQPLREMLQFIGEATSGVGISATYTALRLVEADTGLCATAKQAVAQAKQFATASICDNPALAVQFPELACGGPGAVAENGQPATYLTGGAPPSTGSGY